MRAFLALFGVLWREAAGRRHILVLYVLLFVCANLVNLLEPWVVGNVLNTVQQAGELANPLQTITWSLLGLLGLTVGFWMFHGPARTLEIQMAFHVRQQLKDHLYGVVSQLPVQWHKDNHSGQTIDKIQKATSALYDFTSGTFVLIEMTVRLIGSVIALALILPVAAIMAVTVSVAALGIVALFDRFLVRWYRTLNQYDHHVAQALHDYLTNITTVITLRLEHLTRTELYRRMTTYFPLFRQMTRVGETKWFLVSVIVSGMTVGVLIWYAWSEFARGAVPLVGTFFTLYSYLQRIGGVFFTFAGKYGATVQQYTNLQAVNPLLEAERDTRDESVRLPQKWQTIGIRGLHFLYHGTENKTLHLRNVHLTLERGRKIALVGESGSGKSTLLTLLRGLQAPESVEVWADERLMPEGLRHLGPHVTLIPQDPEIFSSTIEYNITVDTEQSQSEVMEDVELARFGPVLARLPKGLQTNVAEKGVNLSGGEKQRLALARGFFAAKGSDIILLDEPTSSVDSRNERLIYQNLFDRFADRCIVSSIHRLHLLSLFDYIYVLEKGEVKEEGSFDQLIDKNGLLARMWEAYQKIVEEEADTMRG